MGSKNSREKAEKLEKHLQKLYDLNIETFDVEIYFKGVNYIRTTKCGNENEEILILLHGYAGTNIYFYPLLSELSTTYQVYCPDLLGMGLSSRPNFDYETSEEAVNFFVESIESWRKVLGLKNFVIGGHSFGGYVACQYYSKYPEYITKMILLSPMGLTKKSTAYDLSKFGEGYNCLLKTLINWGMQFWRNKMTPSTAVYYYRSLCLNWIIRKFFIKRIRVSQEIGKTLWDLLIETFKLPLSSEKAIHLLVNPRIVAYLPLEDILSEIEIPTLVLYGEKDWMCDAGAKRIKAKEKPNFELEYISDSGHQITFENFKEVLNVIKNSKVISGRVNVPI